MGMPEGILGSQLSAEISDYKLGF